MSSKSSPQSSIGQAIWTRSDDPSRSMIHGTSVVVPRTGCYGNAPACRRYGSLNSCPQIDDAPLEGVGREEEQGWPNR
jgi:hypothetical protein